MSNTEKELSITRLVDLSPAEMFKAWTTPDLMKQWWAPAPFTTPSVDVELRVGGKFNFVMKGPDGTEYPNKGVFLEIVENERLVWSDAFTAGWNPKPDPFMVGIITFEREEGKTRYTATARHWGVETCQKHAEMGFAVGWNQALDQLIAVMGGGKG